MLTGLVAVPDIGAHSRFDAWTMDTGLPQNSVPAILQTRDGYLWFATLGGLVRYDGVRFTVFDKANSKGIKSNRLTTLFEDVAGDLWIGTEDSGLIRYREGTFTTYTTGDGLPGDWVTAIEGDERGRLLVMTGKGEGIAQWMNGRFTILLSGRSFPLASDSAWSWPSRGGITFIDRTGLHRFVEGRLVTYTMAERLPSLQINSVQKDQHGTLWIGTKDRGINRFKDNVFTVYTVADGLPSNDVKLTAACEDGKGNLWFATDWGLGRLEDGKLTTYGVTDGLPRDQIAAIYEDREGSIWVGTTSKGLYRFRKEVVTTYSERDGLSASNVYPIYEDRAGNVWIGAWPGLNKYRDGRFTRLLKKDGQPFSLVSALHEDAEGGFWIGTYSPDGLTRLKDGKFTAYTTHDGLAADAVLAIHQDRTGSFWIGTTAGLNRYRNGKFTAYTTKDGLPGNEVKTIYEDRAGIIWIGTVGGLAKFSDEHFVAYTEREGLSGQHVRAIYEDADGVLWIGTYDGGLNRLKDGKFTCYTRRDGLFDNGVFRILEDDWGNFWMSSNRGIYRVSRRELNDFAAGRTRIITSISYGKNDGMLSAECNGVSSPAGWKTRDGRLWFPTQEGVAVLDPAAIKTNELPPPVHLEEFSIDNASVPFRGGVQLSPGQERFAIRYTGISFIKPEFIKFKYQLEGLDEQWVDAGGQRTAHYSHVPPGRYTFRVIAANSDGVWNTEGQSLRIVVIPPFYRRWWFVSLGALSLIGLSFLIFRRRVLQLQREKGAQETLSRRLIEFQENERKRLASELHDGLSQNLVIIKNRATMSLNTPDDITHAFEQMEEIAQAATESLAEVREIAHNLRPFQIDRLGLTKAIEALVRKANSPALRALARLDKVDALLSPEMEINLYRIVQESLNNIIKHSEASEATITIVQNGKTIELTIQDNGQGFNPHMARIGESNDGGGLGLAGIVERARILGCVPLIESAPGRGTTIRLKAVV